MYATFPARPPQLQFRRVFLWLILAIHAKAGTMIRRDSIPKL